MKFTLKGKITFSKDATEAQEDIKTFIEDANKELLLRGLGSEPETSGAKITDWNIDGDKLNLTIESGHKIRAHDGLLRLKKPLSQLVGKKYHLGVRDLYIDSYIVKIPTDEYNFDKDAASKIEQISKIEEADDVACIEIDDISESDIKNQSINRIIKQVSNKNEDELLGEDGEKLDLTYKMNSTPGEIVYRSDKFEMFPVDDVTEKALELGWIKRFPGKGQWFYGPKMTALHRAFEEILVENVMEKLEFEECLFPKLIPFEVLDKMRYLEGLPEGMYYVSAPKRDPEAFDKFKQELIINNEIPIDLLKKGLKDPGYVNAAAQCEPFYEFLSHEVVDEKDLPIKSYDRSGWTYRWEGGGAKGLDRVHEFQRIETVWCGTPEQVDEIRDQTLLLSQDLASKLELEWYTEVGDDPFYLEGRKVENRGIEFPDVPKYEMRLVNPSQEKGVAVVSANVHGTHFVEGFSIKEAHQHRIWTGCTGFGLTRWLFGFLAQKGFDKENWPKMVADRVKDAKNPKVVTWPKQ